MRIFRRLTFRRLYQKLLGSDDIKVGEKENILIRVYKFSYRNIGLLMVILISFWIENSGEKYVTRERYREMIITIRKDIKIFKGYTHNYSGQIAAKRDVYQNQYEIWENNNDSIFVICNNSPCWAPLSLFKDFQPFNASLKGFNMFEKGGIDFEFMYPEITQLIYKLYNEDILYVKINSSIIDEKYAAEFEAQVAQKWAFELDEVLLEDHNFWIKNRRYIQRDKGLKFNLHRRIVQWDQTLEQLHDFEKGLDKTLYLLDSLSLEIDRKINLLYWQI